MNGTWSATTRKATCSDPNDIGKAVKKVYQRRLRDYATEFGELNRQRVMLMASIAAVTEDNARLKTAPASAEKLGAFREEEIRKLNIDLAGVTKERAIIEKHLATVEQQLADDAQAARPGDRRESPPGRRSGPPRGTSGCSVRVALRPAARWPPRRNPAANRSRRACSAPAKWRCLNRALCVQCGGCVQCRRHS